jgi:ABC-type amino acid transport/signal transduction systems, periplasmic component/domain
MKKRFLLIALALLMCIPFAACSDTKEEKAAEQPAEEAEVTETAESDLAYIQGNGKLIIGYTVYAPMNYTDDEGNFTGFDTELASAVCAKLGVEPDFVEINWDTKELELNAKSIDCIWNGLTITDERKENMAITVPYVKNAQVIVMKADAEYTDTASLIGAAVCAEAGSAGEGVIAEDENLKQAEYVAKDVQTACLMEVAAGTANAAVLDLTLANAMIGEGTDYANLQIKARLAVEDYGIAFRKGSDACDAVNAALAELATEGTMAALAEKYGLDLAE